MNDGGDRWALTQATSGPQKRIELDQERFGRLVRARTGLFRIQAIERTFDMVMMNYAALERGLFNLTMDRMLHRTALRYEAAHEALLRVDRLLLNLFSACRSYIDQTKHHLSDAFGKESAVYAAFLDWLSQEYDAHVEYRTLEALRNFVQHRAMPVHRLSFPSSRVESDVHEKDSLHFGVSAYLDVETLRIEGNFKSAVAEELDEVFADEPHAVPLKSFCRMYVSCLSTVHDKLRQEVDTTFSRWRSLIEGAIQEFRDAAPSGKEHTVMLVEYSETGEILQEHELFMKFIEFTEYLRLKNPATGSLERWHVDYSN